MWPAQRRAVLVRSYRSHYTPENRLSPARHPDERQRDPSHRKGPIPPSPPRKRQRTPAPTRQLRVNFSPDASKTPSQRTKFADAAHDPARRQRGAIELAGRLEGVLHGIDRAVESLGDVELLVAGGSKSYPTPYRLPIDEDEAAFRERNLANLENIVVPQDVRLAEQAVSDVTRVALECDKLGAHGFAVTRPPGHHASDRSVDGFCIVNTIANAAANVMRLARKHVLIVDIDVHHGDGTQDLIPRLNSSGEQACKLVSFYARDVHFGQPLRQSQHVRTEPYGWRFSDVARYREWRGRVKATVEEVFDTLAPECVVLVSTGFDAGDELVGSPEVDPLFYFHAVGAIREAVRGRPIVLSLEGGYDGGVSERVESAVWGLYRNETRLACAAWNGDRSRFYGAELGGEVPCGGTVVFAARGPRDEDRVVAVDYPGSSSERGLAGRIVAWRVHDDGDLYMCGRGAQHAGVFPLGHVWNQLAPGMRFVQRFEGGQEFGATVASVKKRRGATSRVTVDYEDGETIEYALRGGRVVQRA